MKQTLLITLLYFSPLLWRGAGGEVHAQQQPIDSLHKLLKEFPETNPKHLEILNLLAEKYCTMQYDSAEAIANRAIKLSLRLKNVTELASAYINKGRILTIKTNYDEAFMYGEKAIALVLKSGNKKELADAYTYIYGQQYFNKSDFKKCYSVLDSAYIIYQQINNYTGMGEALYTRLNFNYYSGKTDSIIEHLNQAIALVEKGSNKSFVSFIYITMSGVYMDKGDSRTCLEYLNKAVTIAEESGNLFYLYGSCGNLAIQYSVIANYPMQLKYSLKALKAAQQLNSPYDMTFCNTILGVLYYDLKEYKKAMPYLLQGEYLGTLYHEYINRTSSQNTIAQIHLSYNNTDSALSYLNKAYAYQVKNNYAVNMPLTCANLGSVYFQKKDYKKAFEYFTKADTLFKKVSDYVSEANFYLAYGNAINSVPDSVLDYAGIEAKNRANASYNYLRKALIVSEKRNLLAPKRDALASLSTFYEKQNNTIPAYKYYKQYSVLKDSILNKDNANSIGTMQIQYDSEKQEQQIESLTKDKNLRHAQIEKQKTTRNAFIGGLVLMLLLAGVTYNRYRMKQKANTEIENTLTHLKNTQEQLVQQGKLAALGKMTAEVAVEIQTPLQTVKLQSDECEKLVEQFSNSKNETEQNQILNKLESILETINQNGKMADGIVKNVLVQSRR